MDIDLEKDQCSNSIPIRDLEADTPNVELCSQLDCDEQNIDINNINTIIQNVSDLGKYIKDLLKEIITDYELGVHFIFILKHHSSYALENNLICNNQLLLYPLTKSIILDYYNYIGRQLNLIPHLKKWKTIYNNKRFWTMNIEDQINNLQELKIKFMSLFDGTHSKILIHNRLRGITNVEGDHIEEIINRLTQVYQLFKYNFFNQINCILIEHNEFIYMSFIKQVDYMEYVYNKINKVLTLYIDYFIEYNLYRDKLECLLDL